MIPSTPAYAGRRALLLLITALLLGSVPAWALTPLAPALSVEVEGVKINYTSTVKSPQALTLVLIHGFGASLESWHDVHPALTAKFQVVRLDLLGHGFTDKPAGGDYSPQGHARLVSGFIGKLGLKRVVLAGHSMGGGIALLLTQPPSPAVPQPFEIAGLVLIASSGYPQPLPFFIEALRDPVLRFFSQLIPAEQRTRYTLERIFFSRAHLTPERVHRYAYFASLPGHFHAQTQTALQIVPADLAQLSTRIKTVRLPTLILWGDQDRVVPLENAHRFKRDIPAATLHIVPQAGHMLPEERPSQVFDFIEYFVKTLR
jgi:pimeloyl-ACP methyl ester carboxylesterase